MNDELAGPRTGWTAKQTERNGLTGAVRTRLQVGPLPHTQPGGCHVVRLNANLVQFHSPRQWVNKVVSGG
jgi:hypothetical protein